MKLILLLVGILAVSGCRSRRYQENCASGDANSCFLMGDNHLRHNRLADARINLAKGCTGNIGESCFKLADLEYKLGEADRALALREKAVGIWKSKCDAGDNAGCTAMAGLNARLRGCAIDDFECSGKVELKVKEEQAAEADERRKNLGEALQKLGDGMKTKTTTCDANSTHYGNRTNTTVTCRN